MKINFDVNPFVTSSVGAVIHNAPLSIPRIEKKDEIMLNQLKSTLIPSSFSMTASSEPVKNQETE